MNRLISSMKWQVGLLAFSAVGFLVTASPYAVGDESNGDRQSSSAIGAIAVHDHAPILIRSKPVIERLPVQVIEPVDVCVTTGGLVYVADRRAQVVFRLATDGKADLVATELDGLRRILADPDQTLYILTGSQGSGRVTYLTPSGFTGEACAVDFAPLAFARDQTGAFILSSASGQTVLINGNEEYQLLATVSEPVNDMVLTTADQIHLLLASGRVVYLGRDGSSATAGYVPAGATRLFPLPDGNLAALHSTVSDRSMITVMTRAADKAGERPFAQIPRGTAAVAFDALGNMCLANPDLRAITRITSRFVVPCPHCSRPLNMILSMDAPEDQPAESTGSRGRSF